jgi:hypothetical protein
MFSFKEHDRQLRRLRDETESFIVQSPNADLRRVLMLRGILHVILSNLEEYDAFTPSTRGWLASSLTEMMAMSVNPDNALHGLQLLARVVREKTIRQGLVNEDERPLLDYFSPFRQPLTEEGDKHRELSEYLAFGLPRNLVEGDTRSALVAVNAGAEKGVAAAAEATAAGARATEVASRIEKWNGELAEWERKVENLRSALERDQHAYNFVLLSGSFRQLLGMKAKALRGLRVLLVIFGVLMLTPVLSQFAPESWPLRVVWDLNTWTKALPLLAAELLLIYFFRIFLMSYYAVQDQLVELELRQSLCAFVESYVDFAQGKSVGAVDDRLAKFESVVFAPIGRQQRAAPTVADVVSVITDGWKKQKAGKEE